MNSIYSSLISETKVDFKGLNNPEQIYKAKVEQHIKAVTIIFNQALEEYPEHKKIPALERRIACYHATQKCGGYTLWCLTCPIISLICCFNILKEKDIEICEAPFECFFENEWPRRSWKDKGGLSWCCPKSRPLFSKIYDLGWKLSEAKFVTNSELQNRDLNPDKINQKIKQMEKFNDPKFMDLSYKIWSEDFTINDLLEEEHVPSEDDVSYFRRPIPIFNLLSDEFIASLDLTQSIHRAVALFFKDQSHQFQLPDVITSLISEYIIENTEEYEEAMRYVRHPGSCSGRLSLGLPINEAEDKESSEVEEKENNEVEEKEEDLENAHSTYQPVATNNLERSN